MSRGKEVDRLKQELSRTSEQRKYLMRTTEMYEADKRELESEVMKDWSTDTLYLLFKNKLFNFTLVTFHTSCCKCLLFALLY